MVKVGLIICNNFKDICFSRSLNVLKWTKKVKKLDCVLNKKLKHDRKLDFKIQEIINFFWFPCDTSTYDFT